MANTRTVVLDATRAQRFAVVFGQDVAQVDTQPGRRHTQRAHRIMMFVPCKGGISHNEIEDALHEHIEAGANVPLLVVLERAG